jgi:uncharacterized protein GlcG (DUF336 family)
MQHDRHTKSPRRNTGSGTFRHIVSVMAAGVFGGAGLVAVADGPREARADDDVSEAACRRLPSHAQLTQALKSVVVLGDASKNGGLANDMWATLVSRDGEVCSVTFSGEDRTAQWPGSRVISAQKANTANAFGLGAGQGGVIPGLALSTGNLYAAVQPGGSLFGLQASNPVDPAVAYTGSATRFGRRNDPMVGHRIGGVNVFGGGLGLYDKNGALIGALGVSGDTACTDHVVAWKVRSGLNLDSVPAGVSATGDDNLILDPANGFGHPVCGFGEGPIVEGLPVDFPTGPNP